MKKVEIYCIMSLVLFVLMAGSDSLLLAVVAAANLIASTFVYDAHRQRRDDDNG